ncbi:MAG: DUF1007 family protein, partial [Pseudomonadota bacterium]|nr:DUF1007 family protein [Pseudomonadota bacterium]
PAHFFAALVTAFWLVNSSAPASAHPHMWIDLHTEVILQEDGKIRAIYQEWLFDDFYSTALLEDASTHPEGLEDGINAEISDILSGLQSWNYFTQILSDAEEIGLKKVTSFTAEVRENRLWISFTAYLEMPVHPLRKTFSYAIFDPTYYIEMYHLENAVVGFQGKNQNRCKGIIIDPNPSSEAVQLSQSSALDSEADASIGQLFAETVKVECE